MTKCDRIASWQKNRVFSVPPLSGYSFVMISVACESTTLRRVRPR